MLEAPGVVGLPHRVGVGHLLRPDEIAPAQLHAIDADLARGFIHEALDVEDRLGPARPAVGAGGCLVGKYGAEIKINHRHVVDAGLHPGTYEQLDDHAGGQRVRANIGK